MVSGLCNHVFLARHIGMLFFGSFWRLKADLKH